MHKIKNYQSPHSGNRFLLFDEPSAFKRHKRINRLVVIENIIIIQINKAIRDTEKNVYAGEDCECNSFQNT